MEIDSAGYLKARARRMDQAVSLPWMKSPIKQGSARPPCPPTTGSLLNMKRRVVEQFGAVCGDQVAALDPQPAPGRVEHGDVDGDHHALLQRSRAARPEDRRLELDDADAVYARIEEVLSQMPFGHDLAADGFDRVASMPGRSASAHAC